MKKYIIGIIILVCILLATTASADSVELLLAGVNNRIAGALNSNEFETLDPVEAAHAAIPGGLGNTGCVLRAKAVVTASAEALTRVSVDDFIVVNYDLLRQVGYDDPTTISPSGLVMDTVECDGERQVHRMVGMSKVSSENLAAEIKIDGRLLYVLVYDWDEDMDKEVCLVAGNSSDMGYRRGSKASSGGSTGGTTNESGSNEPAAEGSSEPDPHYRDWASDAGSGSSSSSSSAPDPHYRNF